MIDLKALALRSSDSMFSKSEMLSKNFRRFEWNMTFVQNCKDKGVISVVFSSS